MSAFKRMPFEADLTLLSIGPEATHRLGDCLKNARLDLKPRNFAERALVQEMAVSHWRGIRIKIMEKAIYDRQATTYRPRNLKTLDGSDAEPYEDMSHLAHAHAPQNSRLLLAALANLEARYHRQFCSAYRLLMASRRGGPPYLPEFKPKSQTAPKSNTTKENATCEL